MTNAGWMVAVREDFGAQTYWRLYLRAQLQDGSLGEPLRSQPWDLSARYNLDPKVYEQGGTYSDVPPGYWVDVTALAIQYGWERVPALPNWRTFYRGARFTEFALTGGLDWYSAMLELYPPDVLVTPTRVLPPTLTPTRTPLPTWTPLPTRTPRPTFTPITHTYTHDHTHAIGHAVAITHPTDDHAMKKIISRVPNGHRDDVSALSQNERLHLRGSRRFRYSSQRHDSFIIIHYSHLLRTFAYQLRKRDQLQRR